MAKRPNWTKVRKAAETGDADAQYLLAWKYEEGHADDEKARTWLEKAARQGHGLAHYRRAHLSRDSAEKVAWLTRDAGSAGGPSGPRSGCGRINITPAWRSGSALPQSARRHAVSSQTPPAPSIWPRMPRGWINVGFSVIARPTIGPDDDHT